MSETSSFNIVQGKGPLGIIANGVSFHYAEDAVMDLGLADRTRILRMGFSNPLPEKLIKKFLAGCEKVLVVEEGEPFMEEAVKAFAQEEGITANPTTCFPGCSNMIQPWSGKRWLPFSMFPIPRRVLWIPRMCRKYPCGLPTCVRVVPTGPRSMKSNRQPKRWM